MGTNTSDFIQGVESKILSAITPQAALCNPFINLSGCKYINRLVYWQLAGQPQ